MMEREEFRAAITDIDISTSARRHLERAVNRVVDGTPVELAVVTRPRIVAL